MFVTFAALEWPQADRYAIRNARVPSCFLGRSDIPTDADGLSLVDVRINGASIESVASSGLLVPMQDDVSIDLSGRQFWPTLVDLHAHLDKAHTIERAPNPDGTHGSARIAAAKDRPQRTHGDIRRRMDFGLRCAYAHGVSAIRSHIDSYPDSAERSWGAVTEMVSRWAGRIELQPVCLCPIDLLQDGFGDRLAAIVADAGGLIGGITRSSLGPHIPVPELEVMLDRVFTLAKRHDLDVDLHVDESGDPAAATLAHVARATLRHGYEGRVVCGHCCSLAVQPDEQVAATLDLVARARIAIVTLPTVNMYLQDRTPGRTPRWRGVTLIREMQARGIAVAAAGDNCRDSFYAYGDHDMVDTFRQAVRILHLDHPWRDSPALVGPSPASIAGLGERHGLIRAGAPARLIAFNARRYDELIARPQSDRIVIDAGRRLLTGVPDYAELWAAMD